MKVLEIVRLAATYLQLNNLLETTMLGGSRAPNKNEVADIYLLVLCCNLTSNIMATDYIKLFKSVATRSVNGKVNIEQLTADGSRLHTVVRITNRNGNRLVYKMFNDYIKTASGDVEVLFTYIPKDVELQEEITDYPQRITERIVAYGVASEFSYIKAMYDDATIWDIRFKNALLSVATEKTGINMPARGWW